MKIKIIKSVIVMGEPAESGQVLDVPRGVSSYLIRAGKAVAHTEAARPIEETNGESVQPASRIVQAPTRKVSRKPKAKPSKREI